MQARMWSIGRTRKLLLVALVIAIAAATLAFPVLTHAAPQSSVGMIPRVTLGVQALPGARVSFTGQEIQLTIDGQTRTVATDDPKRLDPLFAQIATVSPDGKTLLYVTGDGEEMRDATFTTVNLATLHKQVIAHLGNTFWINAPRWSPDCSQIAYGMENLTTFAPELWVMSVTGTNQRMVATGGALSASSFEGRETMAPSWSADGKSLVFYDNAYRPSVQWTTNVATGARGQTSLASSVPHDCFISPDGTWYCGGTQKGCWNVPMYRQGDPQWSGMLMQTANQSIGGYGCALTSLTMLFDYFGSTVGNPGGMVNCLNPWGYADGLNWYGAQVNPPNGPGCDRYTSNFIGRPGFSWSNLDSYLRSGWPVIVGMCYDGTTCNSTHFFVVVKGDGSDNPANYWINDPFDGKQKQMSNYTGGNDYLAWTVLYQSANGNHTPACE